MNEIVRFGRISAFPTTARAHRAGMWTRAIMGDTRAVEWCKTHRLGLTRAQTEGQNSVGGFLVPAEIMNTIFSLREQYGAFRAAADIVPMRRDVMSWPRRTSGLTARFSAEGVAFTEDQIALDNFSLTAKKLGTFARSSTELDEDSAADLGEWFVREMAYAFALKEDQCGFNGDGTSAYGGIKGICPTIIDGGHGACKLTATGHATFAALDNTDLTGLLALAPAYALPGARWFVSQFGYATTFCRLAAVAGGIVTMTINGRIVPTFLGFPVQLSQVLPQVGTSLTGQVMCLFGDLSLAAALGERRVMTVATSTHRYMELDQIAFRGSERVDINIHDLGDNTNAGPIVGLVGG